MDRKCTQTPLCPSLPLNNSVIMVSS